MKVTSTKIIIMDSGRIGSSFAYTLVAGGTCSDIVLMGITEGLAGVRR